MSFWRVVLDDLVALNSRPKSIVYNVFFSGSFHLIFLHRVSSLFWQRGHKFIARRFSDAIRVIYACDISPALRLGPGCMFIHPFCVVLGDDAILGKGCKIYNGVTIGNRKGNSSDGMAVLGNGVILGTGCKLLGSISVGHNAKIGANSVLLISIPDGATAVGVPARVVSDAQNF